MTQINDPPRIIFKQSGGITGLRRQCTLEINALPPRARRAMSALDKAEWSRPGEAARDFLSYEIVISKKGRKKSFRFTDQFIPSQAQPLLAYLVEKATPLA